MPNRDSDPIGTSSRLSRIFGTTPVGSLVPTSRPEGGTRGDRVVRNSCVARPDPSPTLATSDVVTERSRVRDDNVQPGLLSDPSRIHQGPDPSPCPDSGEWDPQRR